MDRVFRHHDLLHLDKSRQVHPSRRGGHHIEVTRFCRGSSISRYIEISCIGIREKTSSVSEAAWDNCTYRDSKVRGRRNPLCGVSTHRSRVIG
jgi:hypothetical protein